MTTISASDSTLDTHATSVPESLVGFALSCVPEPRAPRGESAPDEDRCTAVHDMVTAIRNGLPYLSVEDRRELAAALLSGLPDQSEAFRMVLEFHRFFGLPVNDTTRTSSELRAKLILEEAREAADELTLPTGSKRGLAKELADMIYVAYGTAVTEGIDLDGAVREVHRSNMSKLVDGEPIMRPDGKVLKGPNYVEPDMRPYVSAGS